MSLNNPIDNIEQTRHFNLPIAIVWSAISEPEKVSAWFGDNAHYKLEVGAEGYFEWLHTECAGQYAMRVEAVEAPRYFAWRWMNKANIPFSQAHSTLVEFILTEVDANTTVLVVKESGFATHEHWQMNTQGWQQELEDLQLMLQQIG